MEAWNITIYWYLLKHGTTWNDLERSTTIWNNLQRARNDLKRPTSSKAQPTTIWTLLTTSKKRRETTNKEQILRLFTVWDNWFSSLTRFPPNIWLQNPAFCLALYLTGVHFQGELQHFGPMGRQKIKCLPIRTWEIAGVRLQDKYMVDDTLRTTLTLVNFYLQGKSQPYEFIKKKQILTKIKDSDLWKWLLGRFDPITLKNDWMLIILCQSNRIERFSNLLRLKFAFKFT